MIVDAYAYPSIILGILSLFGTIILHATLPPDTGLYLHGASWFYPSPLGRALGSLGGYTGIALLTAISATFFPFVVYQIARKNGRDAKAAAWIMVFSPACWYLFAVSVDAVAAMFLVFPMLIKSRKIGLFSLAIAALLHLALLPSALAIAGIRHLRGVAAAFAVALCGALAVAYMVATPYGLLVSHHIDLLRFGWTGIATFSVGVAPAFIYILLSRNHVNLDGLFFTGLIVSAIGGLEAAIQQHFQPRYCLAGAILLAAGIAPDAVSVYVYEKGARFSRKDSSPLRAGIPTIHERG